LQHKEACRHGSAHELHSKDQREAEHVEHVYV
jgi:hypothetical protein